MNMQHLWTLAAILIVYLSQNGNGAPISETRRNEREELLDALKRLDLMLNSITDTEAEALPEIVSEESEKNENQRETSSEDSREIFKRMGDSPSKRFGDGPMPYKRMGDGPMPYKRMGDGPMPYKRMGDGPMPYRKRMGDGPMPYKRMGDGPMPYKRMGDGPMPYKRGEDSSDSRQSYPEYIYVEIPEERQTRDYEYVEENEDDTAEPLEEQETIEDIKRSIEEWKKSLEERERSIEEREKTIEEKENSMAKKDLLLRKVLGYLQQLQTVNEERRDHDIPFPSKREPNTDGRENVPSETDRP